MIEFKCDRCKAVFDPASDDGGGSFRIERQYDGEGWVEYCAPFELCATCVDVFYTKLEEFTGDSGQERDVDLRIPREA